jgi:hypothetical protein
VNDGLLWVLEVGYIRKVHKGISLSDLSLDGGHRFFGMLKIDSDRGG